MSPQALAQSKREPAKRASSWSSDLSRSSNVRRLRSLQMHHIKHSGTRFQMLEECFPNQFHHWLESRIKLWKYNMKSRFLYFSPKPHLSHMYSKKTQFTWSYVFFKSNLPIRPGISAFNLQSKHSFAIKAESRIFLPHIRIFCASEINAPNTICSLLAKAFATLLLTPLMRLIGPKSLRLWCLQPLIFYNEWDESGIWASFKHTSVSLTG